MAVRRGSTVVVVVVVVVAVEVEIVVIVFLYCAVLSRGRYWFQQALFFCDFVE